MKRCIFLDRDGVLNYDDANYVYQADKYVLYPDVPETLKKWHDDGYLLIVITNQAGISRNLYTIEDMENCHNKLQSECGHIISDIFYSPYHPTITESLSRKPGTLLFEKAIAKWDIDPIQSWMIGDKASDLSPAKKLGMRTIAMMRGPYIPHAEHFVDNLNQAYIAIKQENIA